MSALVPSIWHTNGGLYCGYGENIEGPPAIGDVLRYTGDRHGVLTGGSGSGKTRRWVEVNAALLTGWSMVIVDPKAILLRMLGAHRAAAGAENVIFDPYNLAKMGSRGCNFLQACNPETDDFLDDVMGQAEGIVEVGNTNEPHWPLSFQELLAAVAMYVRLVIPNGTYADVRALLAQPNVALREMIMGDTFEYNGATYPGIMRAGIDYDWEEIGNKAARFGSINDQSRELHSILSTGLTQTRSFDSRAIKKELAGPAFDFSVMKERPVTVWLILPARRLVTHSKWLRLALTTIIQTLLSDTAAKVPVAIICDEAAALGHLPILENTVGLMREYGLKLITIWQDLGQLKDIYKDRWESFIGNAGIFQSFSTQDAFSSEYISRLTGQTTRQAVSLGLSQNLQAGAPPSFSSSATTAPFPMPLMLPQDVRTMGDGHTVLFSHRIKEGMVRAYLPYPTEIHGLEAICALDPSAQPHGKANFSNSQ